MKRKSINLNLVGSIINNISIIGYESTLDSKNRYRQYFICKCFCGNEFRSRVDAIKAGQTASCGCISFDLISQKNRLPNDESLINLIYRNYKNSAEKKI